MRDPRTAVGSVFTVALGDGRSGYGQVVGQFEAGVYLAAFDVVTGADEQLDPVTVAQSPLLFLALFFDDRLSGGAWPVVGRAPVRPGLPLPAYKVNTGHPPVTHVVDHTGTRRRPATAEEAAGLSYRTTHSASRFVHAVQAHAGTRGRVEDYAVLRPAVGRRTHDFFAEPAPPAELGNGRADTEESVQLHYVLHGGSYGSEDERAWVAQLEDALEALLAASQVGDLDGDELGGGRAVLFLHGPDCSVLWDAVERTARDVPLRPAFALITPARGEARHVDL